MNRFIITNVQSSGIEVEITFQCGRKAICRDEWATLAPILAPGDIVCIIPSPPDDACDDTCSLLDQASVEAYIDLQIPSGVIVIDCQKHTIVLHPDELVTPTHMAASSFCPLDPLISRVASFPLPDPPQPSLIEGSVIHQLIQELVISAGLEPTLASERLSPNSAAQRAARILLETSRNDLALMDPATSDALISRICQHACAVAAWVAQKTQVTAVPQNFIQAVKTFSTGAADIRLCFLGGIEVPVGSPHLGITGKIDLLMGLDMNQSISVTKATPWVDGESLRRANTDNVLLNGLPPPPKVRQMTYVGVAPIELKTSLPKTLGAQTTNGQYVDTHSTLFSQLSVREFTGTPAASHSLQVQSYALSLQFGHPPQMKPFEQMSQANDLPVYPLLKYTLHPRADFSVLLQRADAICAVMTRNRCAHDIRAARKLPDGLPRGMLASACGSCAKSPICQALQDDFLRHWLRLLSLEYPVLDAGPVTKSEIDPQRAWRVLKVSPSERENQTPQEAASVSHAGQSRLPPPTHMLCSGLAPLNYELVRPATTGKMVVLCDAGRTPPTDFHEGDLVRVSILGDNQYDMALRIAFARVVSVKGTDVKLETSTDGSSLAGLVEPGTFLVPTVHEPTISARSYIGSIMGLYAPQPGPHTIISTLLRDGPMPLRYREPPHFESERLNVEQCRAVSAIVNCSANIIILEGFPGAGKTSTLATAIATLIHAGNRVLVTAHTHLAVCNVLQELLTLDESVAGYCLPVELDMRLIPSLAQYEFCKSDVIEELEKLELTPDLKPTSPSQIVHYRRALNDVISVRRKQLMDVRAVFCTSLRAASVPSFASICGGDTDFDVVIIDECSQAILPASLIPLSRTTRTIVLSGDIKQMGPVVRNPEAERGGLGVSLMEALPKDLFTVTLTKQYRMCEELCLIANDLTYEGQLSCGSQEVARRQFQLPRISSIEWVQAALGPDHAVTVLVDDFVGQEHTVEELDAALIRVTQVLSSELISCGLLPRNAAVIAPYRRLIQQLINSVPTGLSVATVDKVQGLTREVIILVCSIPAKQIESHLDCPLLADDRRVNVALTRARTKVIVIGTRKHLAENSGRLMNQWLDLSTQVKAA